jgi:site-specific recombinase XerD
MKSEIIEKYRRNASTLSNGQVFPLVTNQHANRCLKIIQEICGIQTPLTFHVARHTFAKTVALKNGVPLKTVQMMMGHTKITTTQIYADVDEEKIFDDMAKMQNALASKRQLFYPLKVRLDEWVSCKIKNASNGRRVTIC